VTAVTNPLPTTGGAGSDAAADVRGNMPLATLALDRLVSVKDYADFSAARAGIGKAVSAGLSDGSREVIYVTIAGVDDASVDVSDDLVEPAVRAAALLPGTADPVQLLLALLSLTGDGQSVRQVITVQPARFEQDTVTVGTDPTGAPDTLTSIAVRNGTTIEGLAALNPALTTITLQPGMQVTVAGGIQPAQLAMFSPDVPQTLLLRSWPPTSPAGRPARWSSAGCSSSPSRSGCSAPTPLPGCALAGWPTSGGRGRSACSTAPPATRSSAGTPRRRSSAAPTTAPRWASTTTSSSRSGWTT